MKKARASRIDKNFTHVASPYGEKLNNLLVSPERAAELKTAARDFPSLDLTSRELCDLEMLAIGAFSPLTTFLNRADYESVLNDMHLSDGTLWPLPIVLETPAKKAEAWTPGTRISLCDSEGVMVAVLTLEEIFERHRRLEAERIYEAPQGNHPDVGYLYKRSDCVCITGRLEVVELPMYHDFTALRQTPAQVRKTLVAENNANIIGYAPRGLLHRAHVEFSRQAALKHGARLVVFAAVGQRMMEEPSYYTRIRAMRAAMEHYPKHTAQLNVLPLSWRQAGSRSVLLNAIIARNFGCTHWIAEHDTHDVGEGAAGKSCYGQYQNIALLERFADDHDLSLISFRDLIPEEDCPEVLLRDPRRAEDDRVREIIQRFSYPNVLQELQRPFRTSVRRGFTLFFTGLSGAGKSTIARVLRARLMEQGERHVTLLDGDVVRKHLSSELGFTREHRDLNILRLGYIASLIAQHRGIAICAPIAPYAATRAQARAMVEPHGAFIEVHVSTSLDVCESRDRKGLYARARKGLIQGFTGISDPYEAPINAEIVIDTAMFSVADAVQHIIGYLTQEGLLAPPAEMTSDNVIVRDQERETVSHVGLDLFASR